MSKFKFTGAMFDFPEYPPGWSPMLAADKAQAALDAHLETLPKVYGFNDAPYGKHDFSPMESFPNKNPTHEAILFNIELTEKPKPCEHVAKYELSIAGVSLKYGPGVSCEKCGAKLKATWTAVV